MKNNLSTLKFAVSNFAFLILGHHESTEVYLSHWLLILDGTH